MSDAVRAQQNDHGAPDMLMRTLRSRTSAANGGDHRKLPLTTVANVARLAFKSLILFTGAPYG